MIKLSLMILSFAIYSCLAGASAEEIGSLRPIPRFDTVTFSRVPNQLVQFLYFCKIWCTTNTSTKSEDPVR